MTTLTLAPNLDLPIEAVTQTFAILGMRGVGKSYTSMVMAEEMLGAGQQIVVVDPIGVYWGLRTSADGDAAGYQVVIAGGDQGDIPLEPDAGELFADLVVDEGLSVVLDLSLLRKGRQRHFMTAFLEHLYHRNRRALHLIVDEADAFAPQRPMRDETRLLGAMEDIVRRGRARGLGITMATQRAAVLNKDVLTQTSVLIALRMVGKTDIDAVDAWVRSFGGDEQRAQLMGSIAKLDVGEAWFWSPGWLGAFERIRIRTRHTFDSSATPEVGAEIVTPAARADVDLDQLRARVEAAIERQESNDPKALKQRVEELERELETARSQADPVPQTVVERVEVPIMPDSTVEALQTALGRLHADVGELVIARKEFNTGLNEARRIASAARVAARFVQPSIDGDERSAQATRKPAQASNGHVEIRAGKRRMLVALAQRYPMVLTPAQLATLSKLTTSGGTYQAYLSELEGAGYIAVANGEVELTDAGLAAVDVVPGRGQTPADVQAMWRGALSGGARRMFDELIETYPQWITRDDLAMRAGLAASGGAFSSYLSTLKRNGLIELENGAVQAAEILFLEGAPA